MKTTQKGYVYLKDKYKRYYGSFTIKDGCVIIEGESNLQSKELLMPRSITRTFLWWSWKEHYKEDGSDAPLGTFARWSEWHWIKERDYTISVVIPLTEIGFIEVTQ